jgi:hypothetical protein
MLEMSRTCWLEKVRLLMSGELVELVRRQPPSASSCLDGQRSPRVGVLPINKTVSQFCRFVERCFLSQVGSNFVFSDHKSESFNFETSCIGVLVDIDIIGCSVCWRCPSVTGKSPSLEFVVLGKELCSGCNESSKSQLSSRRLFKG